MISLTRPLCRGLWPDPEFTGLDWHQLTRSKAGVNAPSYKKRTLTYPVWCLEGLESIKKLWQSKNPVFARHELKWRHQQWQRWRWRWWTSIWKQRKAVIIIMTCRWKWALTSLPISSNSGSGQQSSPMSPSSGQIMSPFFKALTSSRLCVFQLQPADGRRNKVCSSCSALCVRWFIFFWHKCFPEL